VRALPTGTVTFLFSDIEGSTRLLDELGPDQYAEVLAEHRRVMREAFAAHGGVEVDTQGDAFFVAFPDAAGALAAAGEAQAALADGPVRVRMGLHTGAPLVTGEGYVGIDVHRGARVMSAGHGGQVLVSEATYAQLDGADGLTDLGLHRLKDLTEPQRLWQLGDGAFPPLKTLYQTNLPVQPAPLVGREAELGELLTLLRESRLVTLTGAGGSGKTRLALQAAAEQVEEFRDGVWWVSLAALRDPALVESTIADAIGAKDALADHLRGNDALLLLDNFEHLLDAAPLVADLLAAAPKVRVLATSRARLGIAAEQVYSVPTLVPDEAVALFVARARQLQPDFQADDAVGEICRRLDGLPLAVELAAARISVLPPEQILRRLGHGLDLLTAGARDAPERQRTLRTTIQWSHDLLGPDERKLFARLALFTGSFRLEAAEAICDADIDTLAALVAQSLARRSGDGRFFFLETIAEFAREQLNSSGEVEHIGRRHAEYYLGEVEPLTWRLRDLEPAAVAYLDAERDNVRAALAWAIDHSEQDLAERLLCSIWFYWFVRGRTDEGDHLAQRIVELSGSDLSLVSADALSVAGELARYQGDLERAAKLKDASVEAFRVDEGPMMFLAPALTDLAHVEARRGNLERARRLADEALERRYDEERRGVGWEGGIAHARYAIANIEFRVGNLETAERTLEEIIESERRDEKMADLAEELAALAQVRRRLGKRHEAILALREGLTQAGSQRHEPSVCECLEVCAHLAVDKARSRVAAKLWGAVDRLRAKGGFGDFYDAAEHERLIERAQAELGSEAFALAAREGRTLELEDAVECGLAALGSP
jgi:predicted ATPase/class 3 adenylate cyclase